MRVGIVGLGAAGLRAAMLLEQAGVNVVLYEGRDRLGGRIRTVTVDQAVYEMGAEWIDADHTRCLDLLQSLDIEVSMGQSWPRRIFHNGEMCSTEELWSDALEDELRVQAAARELSKSLSRIAYANSSRGDLDGRTLGDFLREHTMSARGLWWATANFRSDEGEDPDSIGLLGWLCSTMPYFDREEGAVSAHRAVGGLGRIVHGMAERIKSTPHLGAVLQRVRQDQIGVSLQFEEFEVDVDRAILTIPPPALEMTVFEPALGSSPRCAVEGIGMSRAIKVFMEYDAHWWRDCGWNGCLMCDTPLQQVWDAGLGDAPVLCAYICGDDARAIANRPDSVRTVAKMVADLVPEANGRYVRGWLHDWMSEPFSHGAFSHLPPNYALSYHKYLARPHGKVHFAGEHTALWNGFVEGALESAERVVQEVLDA